ncbi:hypothetical protein Tco_0455339 [Tanacetum coccineum]
MWGDLQLGIESYQTKINLERPNWDAADYYFKEDYTIVPKPRAVVYETENDQESNAVNELQQGGGWEMVVVVRGEDGGGGVVWVGRNGSGECRGGMMLRMMMMVGLRWLVRFVLGVVDGGVEWM